MFLLRYLGLVVLAGLAYWWLLRFRYKYSLTQKQFNLLVVTSAVLIVVLGLIVTGRLPIHFIAAPVMVAGTFLLRNLPWLFRLLPVFQTLRSRVGAGMGGNGGRKRASDTSTIRTDWFAMELQHESGDMDGTVLRGTFEGRRLSDLDLEELSQLAQDCQQDSDSIQVLTAYMDRTHPHWRDDDQQGGAGSQQEAPGDGGEMTESLALEILGLSPGATKKEIIKAHRHLMQKMHPDRGGSGYLAMKINAAKDCLLEKG